MNRYTLLLEEGNFYHIYNQGNNGENLFYNDDNYIYFMKKFDQYLSDVVELFAFCLMPNHFHFLVRIKMFDEIDEKVREEIMAVINKPNKPNKLNKLNKPNKPVKFQKLNRFEDRFEDRFKDRFKGFISNHFRLFFMSYSKAINKQMGRKGSLFRENFKRKKITSLSYLQNTIIYIHRNPQHHNFIDDFRNYRWSSYERITEEKITKLRKHEVLEWFDNKNNYRLLHKQNIEDNIE